MLTKDEKKEFRFLSTYSKTAFSGLPLTPGLQLRHFKRMDRLKFLRNKKFCVKKK